ncbi:alpha-amylase family glycosyl hydrolase [bacterium]|nr:alpha-amylase family glycosyl hydrolase [bacterium]
MTASPISLTLSAALLAAALLPAVPAAAQGQVSVPSQRQRVATPAGPSSFVQQLFVVSNWHAELRVTLTEQLGTGADLYLRKGAPPTLTDWDARSRTSGTSNEVIVMDAGSFPPLESGIWYVGVYRPAGSVYDLDIERGSKASTRPGMGAMPYAGGATFRVWAPDADAVSVAGPFNAWSPSSAPLSAEGDGNWSLDVRGLGAGDRYKYVVDTGAQLNWRADPRSRQVTNSVGDSVIVDPDAFAWTGQFFTPQWNDTVHYEMHIGTFNDLPGGAPGSFGSALQRLDHLQSLGVNMIALMPINEFPGEFSWGYNPAHPYAPETAYGDVEDVKRFVQAAHDRGIGVTLDVLYNHLGPNDIPHWQFDGSFPGRSGGNYFYDDFNAQTPWGNTRPDYGRGEVRQYIRDNALMWLEEFRMDGLRFDATAYIREGPGGDLPDGWSLMQWINNEIDAVQPWKLIIAEDMRLNEWVTKPTGAGGAGFDSQWDAGFVHPIRAAVITPNDADRDMWSVRDVLYARYNADAFERVVYTESHDEVANGRSRVPEEIWPGNAASWYSKKRSTLGAAIVMTAPGIPMLFQGQELLEDGFFTDTDPIDWSRAVTFGGIRDLYRDLISMRRNLGGFTQGLRGQHINVHHVNNGAKAIAYHRWDAGGAGDDVVVFANFGAASYPSYRVGVPRPGWWHLRFNSDAAIYDPAFGNHPSGGVQAEPIPYDGMPYSLNLSVGPYTALVFSQ